MRTYKQGVGECTSCKTALPPGANFCFSCGARQEAPRSGDPLIGQTIGAYRVLSVLGEGGVGKVYRAEQTSLGRAVCIKTLLPHFARDQTLIQRFQREAQTASGLRHPNIAGVLDVGQTNEGLLFIVMELVEGRSLRAVLKEDSPLPLDRALTLMDQMLSALEEAHSAGIVHRDLKPENVLVARLRDGSDLAKVVDFGLAKLMGEEGAEAQLTRTGQVFGTPAYMAPEQILGEQVDHRADIYALGVMFYELLTGQRLFTGSLKDLFHAHLSTIPEAPSRRAAMPVPPSLDALALRALEKRRERRFSSALELKRGIEAVRAGLGHGGLRTPVATTPVPAPMPLAPELLQPIPATPAHEVPPSAHRAPPSAPRSFGGDGSFRPVGAPSIQAGMSPPPSFDRRPEPTRVPTTGPSLANPEPSLFQPASPDQTGVVLDSLRRVMPQKLVEHISDLKDVLEGERRNVTVLFGDISGFTAMSETMAPEDVRALMNRCFDGMVEAVARYDGTVDKFIGDCIMVLFGAPIAHEDDPERAVRCALEMQAYLGEVNKTLDRALGMRIGINAGEVVAGGVGGQRRMDYTVMGDVVNVAQRLESNASVGSILVSKSVRQLADRGFAYRELNPIRVKGKREPLEVFEVIGLEGSEAEEQGVLVGREEELETLRKILVDAQSGNSAGVLLLGDAGTGKSRLLTEMQRMARANGLRIARGRAGRFGTASSFDIMRQSLFSLAGGSPTDVNDADDKLSSLTTLGVSDANVLRLQHLFGGAPARAGFESQDNLVLDRAATLEPFLHAAAEGLILLVDDAHMADSDSLALIDELMNRARGQRLGIIAAARPGDSDRLLRSLPRIDLRPLAEKAIGEVARIELGGGAVPLPALSAIIERADGNPWIARELVRAFIDRGALQLAGGTWYATEELETGVLPDRLQLLLAARIDELSASAKRLLRSAAIVGRVFTLDLVAAMVDGTFDLASALGECTNRGFVFPAELRGAYQFSQAAVHDAIARGLTQSDARYLHGRLAEALERGLRLGDEHPAEAMAHHFLAAEQHRKAAQYLIVAADRLADRSAFGAASGHYRKALEIMARAMGRGSPSEHAAAQLLSVAAKATACTSMSAPEQAPTLLDSFQLTIPDDRAKLERAEAYRQQGRALLKLTRVHDAHDKLESALHLLTGRSDRPELIANIRADLASVDEARGNLPAAAEHLMEGLRWISGRAADTDLMWTYLNQLGRVHLKSKQLPRAREFFENARTHAQKIRSDLGEAKALTNMASVVAMGGDQVGALSMLSEARELSEKAGDEIGVARIDYNAGLLLAAAGRRDEAAQRLALSLQRAKSIGWREGESASAQAIEAIRGAQDRTII